MPLLGEKMTQLEKIIKIMEQTEEQGFVKYSQEFWYAVRKEVKKLKTAEEVCGKD